MASKEVQVDLHKSVLKQFDHLEYLGLLLDLALPLEKLQTLPSLNTTVQEKKKPFTFACGT